MITLNNIPRKKLKIILCGSGIVIAMSILAVTPPLSHDSDGKTVNPGKASALKAPKNQAGQAEQGSIDLSSSSDSSGTSDGYTLQGTAVTPSTIQTPTANNGNSGSPVSASPVTEPDPLYPVDPTPKCYYNWKPGTNQPYSCPVCEGVQSADGMRYPCGPCYGGGGGVQIMCANPY